MIDIARQQRLERRQAKRREARANRRTLTKSLAEGKLEHAFLSWDIDPTLALLFAQRAAMVLAPGQVVSMAVAVEKG